MSQGAGEDLVDLEPEELRTAIRAYLDKGPDFIKYGGTAHFARPAFIGFSPAAQKVIVDEAHRRNKSAETHATTLDGLRLSIDAGIDLIQHPELMGPREITDALVKMIVERKIVCSMLVSTITGDAWKKAMKDRDEAVAKRGDDKAQASQRARTGAELRQRAAEDALEIQMRRKNAQSSARRAQGPAASAGWGQPLSRVLPLRGTRARPVDWCCVCRVDTRGRTAVRESASTASCCHPAG